VDIPVLYRRVNNLLYAKHLLMDVLEPKIKNAAMERGGTPTLLRGYDIEPASPLFDPLRDGQQWRAVFDRGHFALKKSVRFISSTHSRF
jgi:hypothetical protein